MRKKIVLLFIISLMGMVAVAADLPAKGKAAPSAATLRSGPGSFPGDPGTPIGGGLVILLGMSATYFLVKRKKE